MDGSFLRKEMTAFSRNLFLQKFPLTLREKCPHSEYFRSVFSRIRTEYSDAPYLSVFSRNAGKCGPEELQIWTLFTQCNIWKSDRVLNTPLTTFSRNLFSPYKFSPFINNPPFNSLAGIIIKTDASHLFFNSINRLSNPLSISQSSSTTVLLEPYLKKQTLINAKKVSAFGVILVRIFPHLDGIRRDTIMTQKQGRTIFAPDLFEEFFSQDRMAR